MALLKHLLWNTGYRWVFVVGLNEKLEHNAALQRVLRQQRNHRTGLLILNHSKIAKKQHFFLLCVVVDVF